MNIKDIFSLDKLVLATVLLWIYRIFLCVVVIGGAVSGLGLIFNGEFLSGLFAIVIGIPLGVLFLRIWVELVYLVVAIHEKLREIRDILKNKSGGKSE